MKSLVLAEKPSVARDIARVLKCNKAMQGAMEGDQYIVTWALGHLVTLADPESYDKKYKEWKLEVLPMLPHPMELVVIPQTGKQYRTVETLLNRKDIKQIIVATDAGREGELVARWILAKSGCRKPLKRLWISSVTDKAIREGFAKLKDGKEYDNLYAAAKARAEADWLVGINATRALTCKHNAQLSCGRVQTPTLNMVAKREVEIRKFQPETYYGITIQAGGCLWNWQDKSSGNTRIFQEEKAKEIEKKLQNSKVTVGKAEKQKKQEQAPGLYDLTELQREANVRFGYSAKETLNYMQNLYESHKVLTYPRTDSRFLTADVAETIKERLSACAVGPYRKMAGMLSMKPIRLNKSFVNDSKVTDHHAIIPTEQYVQMDKMSVGERRIYDLVVKRFLAVLYPPCEYEIFTLIGETAGETFRARGKEMLISGWKEVYEGETQPGEDDEVVVKSLPRLDKGVTLSLDKITLNQGKTKPPAPLSEATLLSAMEKGGLGTVATRAEIIDKLFHSFLMEKRGNDIFITAKARQLLILVPEKLKEPQLTAEWEKKLLQISEGKLKSQQFLSEITAYTKKITDDIRQDEGTFRHENMTNKKCPDCGKRLLEVNGKKSKMLVCQDRDCGYRETLSVVSNARCPKCHKRMEMVKRESEDIFVCVCGHKEKLSAFQERRKKEGAGVSKKDVQQFLNSQKKEELLNNPFAAAFEKLNLK